MWKNNWKIAFRHLLKHKTASAVNISGLAIGMAACLLILQYISFHWSFDHYHDNGKNIYRVINDRFQNGKLVQHGTITYSAIGRAMQEDFPDDVAAYCRVYRFNSLILVYGDKKSDEQGIAVDDNFFRMFSFPLLAGNAATALENANCIILSETVARKLVSGGTDYRSLLNQAITIENDTIPYKITGIVADPPANSHMKFAFLFSYRSLYSGGNGNWKEADHDFSTSDFYHYIQLKPGADYQAFNKKLAGFSQKHFDGNKVSGSDEVFYLQPHYQTHLYSDLEYDFADTNSAVTIWGLLAIALFIIINAWVNYINLATAAFGRTRQRGGYS